MGVGAGVGLGRGVGVFVVVDVARGVGEGKESVGEGVTVGVNGGVAVGVGEAVAVRVAVTTLVGRGVGRRCPPTTPRVALAGGVGSAPPQAETTTALAITTNLATAQETGPHLAITGFNLRPMLEFVANLP